MSGMKIFVMWVALVASVLGADVPLLESKTGARLVCEEPVFNFGEVPHRQVVTHLFDVKNVGDMSMSVKGVYASCSCTTGMISKKEILPGQTVKVTLRFNPGRRHGHQKKGVWIQSADGQTPALRLYVEGRVKRPEAE